MDDGGLATGRVGLLEVAAVPATLQLLVVVASCVEEEDVVVGGGSRGDEGDVRNDGPCPSPSQSQSLSLSPI